MLPALSAVVVPRCGLRTSKGCKARFPDHWLISGPRRLCLERVPLSKRAGNRVPRSEGGVR
eukprot:6212953-Pleurochrysis_carterae.AAC.3